MSISLERYRNGVREVHAELMLHPDGATITQLSIATKIAKSSLQIILEENPLFYVDRWMLTGTGSHARVWALNVSSNYEDCPRP
jgi:hypothetical protein